MQTLTAQQAIEAALAATTSSDCVAIAQDHHSANLRWANNTLTTNGVMQGLDVTVVAIRDGASASLSRSVATREQVTALVSDADAAVRDAERADDANPLIEGGQCSDWDEEAALTSIEVFEEFARGLGEEFRMAEEQHRILYGFVSHELVTTYLGTSSGLRLRHVQPTGHYACTGKSADLARSAWVGGATRDFTDVDAHAMARDLSTRLAWAERQVDLSAGRYDTVLPPTAVADLMIEAYWSAGAQVAADGQTAFSRPGGRTRIGEQVASPRVTLRSDPAHPYLECAPFVIAAMSSNESSVFDNGLALARTDWIREGVLTSLLQTRHSASRMSQPVTPEVDNLVLEVEGGTGDLNDMVAGTKHGLLLTCLWYIREVDAQSMLLTGLTRDGVYLVEDGEITAAVNNFRFNESPLDILNRFTHASQSGPAFSREWGDDFFSRTEMPALRVPDFNMSSVSQAR